MQKRKVMLSALEPSANLHFLPIYEEIKDKYEFIGIFDKQFGEPIVNSKEFSVMGFLDVIPKISLALKSIKKLVKLSFEVEKVILIDSPAFNLPLAKAIKKKNPNVEIIYYILPQVWAWKKRRVKKVEQYCDKLASIVPMDKNFYTKSKYVGHPLLDEIPKFKEKIETNNIVSFLPGSRKSEIKSLMPIFRDLRKKLNKEAILVIPKHFSNEEIENIYGDVSEFSIKREVYETLYKSDFAFVCSGTATLEASLIGTPFVLVYKAKKIDYAIARTFVKLNYAGLANIILEHLGKEVLHEEFFQEDVNVENLLNSYKVTNKEKFFKNSKFCMKF